MANPLQHAQKSHENTERQVKPYVGELLPRLVNNYGLLFLLALLVSLFLVPLLANWIPQSTATILGYALNLLLLVYGSRFLEGRNKATGLYVLYSRYSRQRRSLETLMKQAEAQSLENSDSLYSSVDLFEEAAKNFLSAAQDAGVKAK